MEQEREKPFIQAFPGFPWEQEEEEGAPDPLDRPDLHVEEEAPQEPFWTLPDMPTEPCPCCGADIPENPSPGYICPVSYTHLVRVG